MNPENDEHDALSEAWRRASADEAGRPAASMRHAILAEATAAARRRTTAANESRYLWRGVASIAVLGFGVMLWRQVGREQPLVDFVLEAPVMPEVMTDREAPQEPPPAEPREPVPVTSPAKEAQSAPVPRRAARDVKANSPPRSLGQDVANEAPPAPAPAVPNPFPAASPAAAAPPTVYGPPAPPAPVPGQSVPAFAPPAPPAPPPPGPPAPPAFGPPFAGQPAAGGGPGGAARAGGGPRGGAAMGAENQAEAAALLQKHFPARYAADASASVWFLRNAAGEVVASGELRPGQQIADITRERQRDYGDTSIRAGWQLVTIRNARGQPVQVYFASVP